MSNWTLDRAREAIEKLGRARLDWSAFASQVTRELQRSIGFDGWCLAQTDPASLLPARAYVSDSPVAASQQRFWQIEYNAGDVNQWPSLARTGPPVGTLSAATGGDLARSRRWDEIMRPAGIADELRAALAVAGNCWGSLSLYRASGARPFSEAEVHHLRQVLGAAAAGARHAWAAGDPVTGIPPALGPGTVIVTASGTPLTATPEATRWLAELSPDRRQDHGASIIYAMTALLAASGTATNPSAAARVRTRTADGHWLEIHASPLAAAVPGCDIAITINVAEPARITPLLMHAHGLSARERQIARLILDGRTLTEIARTLHISSYTAKDHLKGTFRKTGTHSRPELTQRLTGHL